MHLLVLSAFRREIQRRDTQGRYVSMHLLVLSAFRPYKRPRARPSNGRLNAPFGAQCFPTSSRDTR